VDALPEPGEFVLKAFLTRHVVGSLPQKLTAFRPHFGHTVLRSSLSAWSPSSTSWPCSPPRAS